MVTEAGGKTGQHGGRAGSEQALATLQGNYPLVSFHPWAVGPGPCQRTIWHLCPGSWAIAGYFQALPPKTGQVPEHCPRQGHSHILTHSPTVSQGLSGEGPSPVLVHLSVWPTHSPGPGSSLAFPLAGLGDTRQPQALPGWRKPEAGQPRGLPRPPSGLPSPAPYCTLAWGTVGPTEVAGTVLREGGTGKAGLSASCCLGLTLPVGTVGGTRSSRSGMGIFPCLSDGQAQVIPSGQTLWLSGHLSAYRRGNNQKALLSTGPVQQSTERPMWQGLGARQIG